VVRATRWCGGNTASAEMWGNSRAQGVFGCELGCPVDWLYRRWPCCRCLEGYPTGSRFTLKVSLVANWGESVDLPAISEVLTDLGSRHLNGRLYWAVFVGVESTSYTPLRSTTCKYY
jgi:hypothetical protein